MLHWMLTYGNGAAAYLAAIAALVCLYAAFRAGRRDLADKARIVAQMAGQAWREIADEWGPVLATSTGRNTLMLKLAGWLGLFLPAAWADHGAKLAVATMLVFFALRTLEGRKRAAGPVITPRDARAMEARAGLSGFGVEMQRRVDLDVPQWSPGFFGAQADQLAQNQGPITDDTISAAKALLSRPPPKKRKPESERSKKRRSRR